MVGAGRESGSARLPQLTIFVSHYTLVLPPPVHLVGGVCPRHVAEGHLKPTAPWCIPFTPAARRHSPGSTVGEVNKLNTLDTEALGAGPDDAKRG